MILPIIHLLSSLAFTLYNMRELVTEWDDFRAILGGSTPELVAMRFPVALSMVMGLVIIGLGIVGLVGMFTRSPKIRIIMTVFYLGYIVANLADAYAGVLISEISPQEPNTFGREILKALVFAAIWIPYFWRSRRVINTFGLADKDQASVVEAFS